MMEYINVFRADDEARDRDFFSEAFFSGLHIRNSNYDCRRQARQPAYPTAGNTSS